MAYVMVDVESDGPIPGDYSMICFGAVLVQEGLQQSFYGRLKPISERWLPEALAISGFSRAETLTFDDPKTVMQAFARWIADHVPGRALFVSDNNGFDFASSTGISGISPAPTRSAIPAPIWARSTKGWSRTHSRTSST